MFTNVVVMGRLTADPELRTTNSGTAVTSFCVAVDRKYAPEKQTDFIDCVAWRHTAEFITRYFSKGNLIAIRGELQTRTWEDKNGNKRKAVEVLATSVSFCGDKKAESTTKYDNGQPGVDINVDDASNGFVVLDDGDLPF